MTPVATILAAALVAGAPNTPAVRAPAVRAAPAARADTGDLGGLPLVEVRARGPGAARPRAVAVVITGDGDWADLVQRVSNTLADSGVGVVAIKARAYLSGHRRTPDDAAADVARVARTYAARWGAPRLLLVGYSRGADMLPVVAPRLPADVRRRVAGVTMLGLAHAASFEFHWSDLVRDTSRPGDVPVAPELPRMRAALPGARLVCVYGTGEKDSGCRDADPSLVARVARPGDHHFDGDYPALGRVALGALAGGA